MTKTAQDRRFGNSLIALTTAVLILAVGFGSHASSTQTPESPSPPGDGARGKHIYAKHCVECHGESGKGDGPAAFSLTPRPRDFSLGRYKIRTTETGSLPTDGDLIRSVRRGLYGTAMPGWQGILSDADIRNVVAHLKTFAPRFATDTPRNFEMYAASGSLIVEMMVSRVKETPPDRVTRGGIMYAKLQCGKCHGNDGRGTGAIATTFEDDWRRPLRATDLTEPWTFHGGAEAMDVFMRFRTGMAGTPMPSFNEAASTEELWDLANYVVSLARKPVWQMNADEITAFYAALDADARAAPLKRGKYLVDTMGCVMCHSPLDSEKRIVSEYAMAGGLRIKVVPFGEYTTGNLTSDKETGLGSWTDDEIKSALTRGVLKDGTRLLPYPMDWASYATLKPEDLNAIVSYLRTIPPIRNKVPGPTKTFLPLYLWGKFKMLILGDDPPMIFYPGNAGSGSGASGGRP